MTKTLRVLRRVAEWPIEHALPGKGRHRPRRVALLPDEPIYPSTTPVPHAIRDEAHLEQLLDAGEVAANAYATCPKTGRRTVHAFYRTGVRKCWDCGTPSAGDAIRPVTQERWES